VVQFEWTRTRIPLSLGALQRQPTQHQPHVFSFFDTGASDYVAAVGLIDAFIALTFFE